MTDDPLRWLRDVQTIVAAGGWAWAQGSSDLAEYVTAHDGLGLTPAEFYARLDQAEEALAAAPDDPGTVELRAFARWLRTAVARPETP